MPGYSGTPLAKKLGIKDGARVLLAGAPEGFENELDGLPATAIVVRAARGKTPFDVIVAFIDAARDLEPAFVKLRSRLTPAGGLWIAWPKKSSGVATDVTENLVRLTGLSIGLVDNKVCAVTEVWSGLRFVVRLKDR